MHEIEVAFPPVAFNKGLSYSLRHTQLTWVAAEWVFKFKFDDWTGFLRIQTHKILLGDRIFFVVVHIHTQFNQIQSMAIKIQFFSIATRRVLHSHEAKKSETATVANFVASFREAKQSRFILIAKLFCIWNSLIYEMEIWFFFHSTECECKCMKKKLYMLIREFTFDRRQQCQAIFNGMFCLELSVNVLTKNVCFSEDRSQFTPKCILAWNSRNTGNTDELSWVFFSNSRVSIFCAQKFVVENINEWINRIPSWSSSKSNLIRTF